MEGTRNFFEPKVTIQLTPAELEAVIDSRVRTALAEVDAHRASVVEWNNGPTPGNASVDLKDNKRKRSDDLRRASYSYLMEKYVATPPGSSNSKKPNYKYKPPLCTRCEKYHSGYCRVICKRCSRIGHIGKNCRNPKTTSNTTTKLSTDPSPSKACFRCGEVGHIMPHCPKIVKVKKEVPEPSS